MAKLINKTQNNFTIVNNSIIRDKRLGIKERGLLLTLLSLPDNWNFSAAGICSLLPDGKATINSTIKNLENLGYLKRQQIKNINGQFSGYDWIITDNPFTDFQKTEKLTTENVLTDFQTQLNTNKSIINKSIINKSKSNLILSQERETIRQGLIEQTGINFLFETENNELDFDIFEVMVDIMTSDQEYFIISGQTIPKAILQKRIQKIDYENIRDIREGILNLSHKIKNIKAYIIKCLYDSSITTNIKYANMVNADMYG